MTSWHGNRASLYSKEVLNQDKMAIVVTEPDEEKDCLPSNGKFHDRILLSSPLLAPQNNQILQSQRIHNRESVVHKYSNTVICILFL
jgi:hypothetical protein